MMNPLKMLGDMNAMRKQAMEIQAVLEKEEYEVTVGNVRIVISGNQNVKLVQVGGQPDEDLKQAFNEAIKKSQQAAASKLAQMSQGMGQ